MLQPSTLLNKQTEINEPKSKEEFITVKYSHSQQPLNNCHVSTFAQRGSLSHYRYPKTYPTFSQLVYNWYISWDCPVSLILNDNISAENITWSTLSFCLSLSLRQKGMSFDDFSWCARERHCSFVSTGELQCIDTVKKPASNLCSSHTL